MKKGFIENEPDRLEEPMELLYDTFQVPTELQVFEVTRTSERKRKNSVSMNRRQFFLKSGSLKKITLTRSEG